MSLLVILWVNVAGKHLSQTLHLVKLQKWKYQKPNHKIMLLFLSHSYEFNIHNIFIFVNQKCALGLKAETQVPGARLENKGSVLLLWKSTQVLLLSSAEEHQALPPRTPGADGENTIGKNTEGKKDVKVHLTTMLKVSPKPPWSTQVLTQLHSLRC